MVDNIAIGKHPLIIRFMKGVYNLRPTTTKNVCVWDVSVVLRYLKNLSPVNKLKLQELTFKLVMLIALTNATRIQTLKFLNIDSMAKMPDEFIFFMDKVLLKQSRPGFKNPNVVLKAYPIDNSLCVYATLEEYLKRTKQSRGNNKQLLLSYIKPYCPVTSSTIARWIKTVMQRAGINVKTFTAHSVRAASVSKAKFNDISIKDIMAKAGWTNVNTFATFYDKTIVATDNFDAGVLN